MNKKLIVVLAVIITVIVTINTMGIINHTGYVSAYENVVGGNYYRARGIIGPDNRVYDFNRYYEIIVKDLNNKEIERYSTGLEAPIASVEEYKRVVEKVLESGEIYVVSMFKDSNRNYHWYQTYYTWSEWYKKYVVKSRSQLVTTYSSDAWWSKYGFIIKHQSTFHVYKFTSKGSEKLTRSFPSELGGLYSGISYRDHSLYLGKDDSLYCVEDKSGKVYKCTNGSWVNTGYLKSNYPNWKDLVGINDLRPSGSSSVIEWHDSYMLNGRRYFVNIDTLSVYYSVNSEPVINETYPTYKVLSVDESTIIPKVYVTDADNDNLTCKYYVDGSTTPSESKVITGTSTKKEVTFGAINVSGWKEGTHTIKFEVSDAEKTVTKEVFINKVSVSIKEKADSISISQVGIDSEAKGKQFTYMYTIGTSSGWLPQKSYTKYSLTPNTTYTVNVQVKDELGTIYKLFTSNKNITTLAQTPKLKLSNPTINTLDLSIIDNNPTSTQYLITVGDKYVNSSGALTNTATWITLSNKKLTVKGLTTGTTYQIRVKAKNSAGVETPYSNRVSGTTLSN